MLTFGIGVGIIGIIEGVGDPIFHNIGGQILALGSAGGIRIVEPTGDAVNYDRLTAAGSRILRPAHSVKGEPGTLIVVLGNERAVG